MSIAHSPWRVRSAAFLAILAAVGCGKSESPPAKPAEEVESAMPASRPVVVVDEPLEAEAGTTLYELAVEGMHCQGCGDTITKKLASVPGVTQARVSFNLKTGWVLVKSGSGTAAPQLVDAVKAAGYKATLSTRPAK